MSKLETSKASGIHFKLSQLAGEWEGVTRTFFDNSGTPADESPMSGTIRSVLDGRFLLHEYKGTFQGKPFEGIAIYGHNLQNGKYQCAWIDSFHMSTGIMLSESNATDKLFSVLGGYEAPEGPPWGWRTEIDMPNNDEVTITATNITPDGEPAGGVETRYRRVR